MDPTLLYSGLHWNKSLQALSKLDITQILNYVGFEGSQRLIKEGYALFVSSYVHDVWTSHDGNTVVVKACCYPTMRKSDPSRQVYFETDTTESSFIRNSYCSCKAGKGKCIHIVAVMHQVLHWISISLDEIPEEGTCTSKEQQWHKPRGPTIESEPVMQVVFARPNSDRQGEPLKCSLAGFSGMKPVAQKDVLKLKVGLKNSGIQIPFSYILSSQTNIVKETRFGNVPISSTLEHQLKAHQSFQIHSAIQSVPHFPDLPISLISLDNVDFLPILQMDVDSAIDLEQNTRGQNNELWHDARKIRITASNFGLICKRKKRVDNDFLLKLYEPKDLKNVKSIAFGKKNEEKARAAYISQMKQKNINIMLLSAGFVVNPGAPFLGCSPDGKVYDDTENSKFGLIEIKCPYSKQTNLTDAFKDPKFYCCELNGKMHLKENSKEFFQVQGQMLVTGIEWCDFIVYNGKNIGIERIYKDNLFCDDMLKSLCFFYKNHWESFLSTNYR